MADKKIIAVVGATGAQGGGLRAVLNDPGSEFAVRALTRKPDSEKGSEFAVRALTRKPDSEARALADAGAEVVEADIDDDQSVARAFSGAYGAFCVTNFWEHFSPDREKSQVQAMAAAAKQGGLQHVIWSTLEDTTKWVPLSDDRMPTLMEHY